MKAKNAPARKAPAKRHAPSHARSGRAGARRRGAAAKPAPLAILLRPATARELDVLAELNRQLIEDEGSRARMGSAALRLRLDRYLGEGWSADLFLLGHETVGYALYRREPDTGDPAGFRIHLRQFFVSRERRRGGIGRAAFDALCKTRLPPGARVVLDVLESNPGGKRFWHSLGFRNHSVTMEWRPPSAHLAARR